IYLQRLCEKEPRLASLLYYYIEYGKPVRQSREVIAALKIESAERELQEANERLNLHVENSPMAIVEWDSSFRVTRWGGQAEQIFGWKDKEVLGKKPLEWKFVYEEDLAVSNVIEKFQSGKEVRNITTLRSYKKDGSVVYCEWYNSILFDKSRKPLSLLSLVQDITDRKRAEKEILELNAELEQRVAQRTAELNSLIEAIPDLIFVVDSESRVTYCNDIFAKAMGFEKKEEIINRSPTDFLAQEQAEQFIKQNREIFHSTQPVHKSEAVIFPNGKLYHLDTIRVLLVNDQQQVYAVLGASRDITELVKIRQELQARTIQLEIANHELQSFSYSASHDLRAPLRAIEGFSTALIEDFPESLNEEARDYLKRIHEATKRMNQLIDALLALSRVARTEMMFEHVSLSRIAEEVVEELKQRELQRRVEITIKPDLYVEGDPRLLRVALENLFDNAWKFTSKKKFTKIEFSTAISSDDKVVYFIRDNGAGFDMAYADKLFGEFQRLHSTNEFNGTGIGLATVKRIINRHGGRVWAESEPNVETTFYFTIES
ncbi:MAG: PAS domain S-box protein, partial [Blastocatellia bacterium]|nr:PAS domain S-box protein [Blastocatellia bacterium]